MQEAHVRVEVDGTEPLNCIFYIQVVALFVQDWRVIDKNTVQDGINSHLVPDNLRYNFVDEVKVYWVLHIVGTELVGVASLIKYIIVENLYHNFESTLKLACVKADSKDFLLAVCLFFGFFLHILVFKDVVHDFFKKTQRLIEDDIAELRAAEDTIFHLFQLIL